jgi:hypothetical protein
VQRQKALPQRTDLRQRALSRDEREPELTLATIHSPQT